MKIPRVTIAIIICGVHWKDLIIGRPINHKNTIIGDKRKRCLGAKVWPKIQLQGIRIVQHVKWPVSGSGGRELPIRKKSHRSSGHGTRRERMRTHPNNINQTRRRRIPSQYGAPSSTPTGNLKSSPKERHSKEQNQPPKATQKREQEETSMCILIAKRKHGLQMLQSMNTTNQRQLQLKQRLHIKTV